MCKQHKVAVEATEQLQSGCCNNATSADPQGNIAEKSDIKSGCCQDSSAADEKMNAKDNGCGCGH